MDTTSFGFKSLPFAPRKVRATEAVLDRIYRAAYAGLRGDSLALAAGMLPVEFNTLIQADDNAEMAMLKGKADSEYEHAMQLANASRAGDVKASLAILQHRHEWAAKQNIDINVQQVHVAHLDAIRTLSTMAMPPSLTQREDFTPPPLTIEHEPINLPEPVRTVSPDVQGRPRRVRKECFETGTATVATGVPEPRSEPPA